jgi:uncharacterized repeat protein (TIGR01451 family)
MLLRRFFQPRLATAMALFLAGLGGPGNRALAVQAPACEPPGMISPPTPEPPRADVCPAPAFLPSEVSLNLEDPPTPIVALRIRTPARVIAGQEIEYRICVENRSPAPAHHLVVRNPMPANSRFVRASPEPHTQSPELEWRLGTLEANARKEIVLVLEPTGSGDVNNCARVVFEHGECVVTRIARPVLRMKKEGPAQALLGQTLGYTITLTNEGDADLTNLLLTDILPPGLEHTGGKNRLSWILGSLAPGQSQSVKYEAVAKRPGRLCNRAIATAAGGIRQEMENCVQVAEAKLGLDVTGPRQAYVNAPASYRIVISNAGTAVLSNVLVSDPIPAKMNFVSASEGGQLAGSQVQWSLGNLQPGDSRTVEVVLRGQAAGRLCNQIMASAEPGLTKQAEACTDFSGAPAVSLQVQDNHDPIEVGGTTSYTITVLNQGTSPVTGVRMVAIVPAEMSVTDVAGAAGARRDGQKVLYQPLNLQAGDSARYRVDVRAERAGQVRFRVELTADQLQAGPVQQEEGTVIVPRCSIGDANRQQGSFSLSSLLHAALGYNGMQTGRSGH